MREQARGFGKKAIDYTLSVGYRFVLGVLMTATLAMIVRITRAPRRAAIQQRSAPSSMARAPLLKVMGLALLPVLAAMLSYPAQAAEPSLRFVDEQKMSVKHGPSEKTVSTSVLLRNDSESELQNLRFSARVQDSEGTVRDDALHINLANPQDASIEELTVKRVDIQIAISGDPSETYTGHLIAKVDGNVLPATRQFEMVPVRLSPLNADWLVFVPLFVAGALVLVRALSISGSEFQLRKPLGSVNWDFGSSWASTLTAVGALLGTVLSAGVLPADTQSLSKPAYAALNLFFGALILIAAFIYNAFRQPKTTNTPSGGSEIQYQGYVWSFLGASAVTLWAVLGELITLWFLLGEMEAQSALTTGVVRVFQGILALTAFLMLVYAWQSIRQIAERPINRQAEQQRLSTLMSSHGVNPPPTNQLEPPLPGWSLL